MSGIVKLKDIAKELEVSVVTVSNALSGKKGVSEAMRLKIIETAQRMGYDYSKYMKKETDNAKIGVVVEKGYLRVGASFYWELYQQVIYAAARRNSVTMFEEIDESATDAGELPRILSEGEVDGVFIIGWFSKPYIQNIVKESKRPVVLLDFYDREFACDAVISNNYVGMYKITRYLLEHGHRDIAFVGSVDMNDNIMDRYFGYRKGLAEWGISVRKEWVLEDRNIRTGEMRVELPERMPTAFACNNDLAAGYLYDKLMERGYRVPEDISVAGYDNYLYGHPFAREITTYNVDMAKMAETAVDILLKKRKKENRHQGVRYIDSYIIERNSVKNISRQLL